MAIAITLPSQDQKSIGLEAWMQRVLDRADDVEGGWEPDKVHDLRTALRRCRTIADALSQVNPGPGWRKLKKESKDLFKSLGSLRDTQVKQNWVKDLADSKDPVRKHLLKILAQQEKKQLKTAKSSLKDFDRRQWKKLTRKLHGKAQFFPPESVVFQRLALVKLNEAVELHRKARTSGSAAAWHMLRKGVKRFRYVAENFLPQRYEVWGADLKHVQDVLGEVHDLDVLRSEIVRRKAELTAARLTAWLTKIDEVRRARLDEFRMEISKRESLWLVWRAGFQWGHTLQIANAPENEKAHFAS